MAGYSGTPLAKKLGLVDGSVARAINPPAGFVDSIDTDVEWRTGDDGPLDVVVAFFVERGEVSAAWTSVTESAGAFAAVWVAWPKKASKVPTDLTEDVFRELLLPTGWVDVKVCAIDDIWSGLKFVMRKELRPSR